MNKLFQKLLLLGIEFNKVPMKLKVASIIIEILVILVIRNILVIFGIKMGVFPTVLLWLFVGEPIGLYIDLKLIRDNNKKN